MLHNVSPNEPGSSAISKLAENCRSAYGRAERAGFWKYELDGLYTALGATGGNNGLYANDVSLGHTLTSCTNWTHIDAQVGMSIWKYPVTNYKHNSINELYINDVKLVYKGSASTVSTPTTFTGVYRSNGKRTSPTYTNLTAEAASSSGTPFNFVSTSIITSAITLTTTTNLGYLNILQGTVSVYNSGLTTRYTENTDYTMDYDLGTITRVSSGSIASGASINVTYTQASELFISYTSKFGSITATLGTLGVGNSLSFAYSSGASSYHTFIPTDATGNWSVNGNITWSASSLTGWTTRAVSSGSGYQIRIRPKSQGIVAPTIWQLLISDNTMTKKLAMSTNDFINQNYTWGYLSGYIYVAIPNSGDVANEGVTYITSSSTSTMKESYFVYNNEYTVNYEFASASTAFVINCGTT